MAFPKGRLWRAHCVEISEGRKIVKARKGLKSLVIRIFRILFCVDCHAHARNDGSEVIHFSTSNNSDNLSRSNSSFVINNFNLIKEDILMKDIKKILTIILSISLLFAISCGDRPTGSSPVSADALISSTPEAKGEPATDLENATYKDTIPIDIKNSDATDNFVKNSGMSKEQLIEMMKTETIELSLTIADNKITLVEIETYNMERLKGVQPLKEGEKYSYKVSDKTVQNYEGGKKLNIEDITYIEFTKSGNDITFTYTTAFSYEGDMPEEIDESGNPIGYIYVSDYGYKETYTGKLIKN